MFQTLTALHLSAIDPALGRLDYASLSDQALMEMLVDGMVEELEDPVLDSAGNYMEVCKWFNVHCTADRVIEVVFHSCDMCKKPFPFEFIPPLVEVLEFTSCHLHGTLDTAALPQNLVYCNVFDNALHGTLNFKDFPKNSETIIISSNNFDGSLALSELPDSVVIFRARFNSFNGNLSLDALPSSMRDLNVRDNLLSGDVWLMNIPPSLEKLSIQENSTSGTLVLSSTFEGDPPFALRSDPLQRVVDESGKEHPWESTIIRSSASWDDTSDGYGDSP